MRIGILTGGGDCPGLNAVIRAIYKRATQHDHSLVGFMYGWRGVIDDLTMDLNELSIRGLLHRGGTILRTSGVSPFQTESGPQRVKDTMERHQLDSLVVIGGEGTMGSASRMHAEHGLPVIGVPKTIDNDLPGTDITFGFDSALTVCTDALDRLTTTAESHNRVMVCEVMGRTAGWLALYSGIAGGAHVIMLPEESMTVEEAAGIIRERHASGRSFSLVVVGEGCQLRSSTGLFDDRREVDQLDAYGYPRMGGVSHHIASAIERLTGFETRVTILGHIQRGGSPTARDRVLASRFGKLAADLAHEAQYGTLCAVRGNEVVAVPIADSAGPPRTVPPELWDLARAFSG